MQKVSRNTILIIDFKSFIIVVIYVKSIKIFGKEKFQNYTNYWRKYNYS